MDDETDDGTDDEMDGWMEKASRCPLLYVMGQGLGFRVFFS